MDERLEKALEFSDHMITLNNQKRLLHEKFLENSVHYINGGKFSVTQVLLNFCNTLLQNNQTETVLIDDNNTPIEIEDLQKFNDTLLNIYFTNINAYFTEYSKIKTKRTIEGIVDL